MNIKKLFLNSYYCKIILGILCFLLLNLITNFFLEDKKLDLTRNKQFTLSSATKEALNNTKKFINLDFYFPKQSLSQVPYFYNYGNRVKDILNEIAYQSGGKVKINIKSFKPYSETDKQALAHGLIKIPLNNEGKGTYLGLVGTGEAEQEEVIKLFVPEREEFLEYDLAKLVLKLQTNDKPHIGILSGVANKNSLKNNLLVRPIEQWGIFKRLQEDYNVSLLKDNIKKIPDNINLIILMQSIAMNTDAFKAIDYYLHAGGKIIILTEPHSDVLLKKKDEFYDKNFKKLLLSWGLSFDNNQILVDPFSSKKTWVLKDGAAALTYKHNWFDLKKDELHFKSQLNKNLTKVTLTNPGSFKVKQYNKMRIKPLIITNNKQLVDKQVLYHKQAQAVFSNRNKINKHENVLGLSLEGKTKLVFYKSDHATTLKDKLTQKFYHAYSQLSGKDSRIFLLSDFDFLLDKFWMIKKTILGQSYSIPYADNAQLVLNLINQLTGYQSLLQLNKSKKEQQTLSRITSMNNKINLSKLNRTKKLKIELDNKKLELIKLTNELKQGMSSDLEKKLKQVLKEKQTVRNKITSINEYYNNQFNQMLNKIKLINLLLLPAVFLLMGFLIIRYRKNKSFIFNNHD